jgi:catechol 2,3-dioxygenase-like lactoylglutathione lyase family enzyme
MFPLLKKVPAAALCLMFCSIAHAQTAAAPEVTGVSNFGHIVANLDKSFAFYKDLLQLDVAITPRAFDPNPAIMKMGNTIGAQSRIGVFKVPGAAFGLELIEYKDIDRKPAKIRNQDPGAGNLILLVRDIEATLARLKQGGAKIVTPGGAALDIGNKTRGAFAQDPDGFFVALVQRDPPPSTTAPATSNVIGGLIAVTAGDTDSTVHLYRDVLGFKQLMEFPYMGDANRMAMGNTPGAQYRSTVLQIPGTQVSIEFPQFKDIDRKPLHTRLQDPGTAVLQLEVRNVDNAVKTLKGAGVEVISVGGEPVDVTISTGATLRIAIVRDPNNLFLELIQRMK